MPSNGEHGDQGSRSKKTEIGEITSETIATNMQQMKE